ncbi:hypothetical protein U0035_08565 [Niabella yanshanensis]|uniref:Uncharacterized protein n=1 Tax=Niabella yanshanensis TaxID=577386 RepID=A0ABZ0WCU4_9BACT|nr:hypothetical protein [Niabella yanshanensis]WQD40195.1 hypothetical protein U0035_08565 [Niabella yanshanensis]
MQISKPKNSTLALFAIAIVSIITLASWSVPMTSGMFSRFFNETDTVPKKCDSKIGELNEAIAQLQKATESLKERDISREVAKAIESINLEDIHNNVEDAMLQAQSALAKVDVQKIKEEVSLALARIDREKIEEQVKLATANLQPQIQKSLEEAKRELEQAKQELESAKQRIRKEKI